MTQLPHLTGETNEATTVDSAWPQLGIRFALLGVYYVLVTLFAFDIVREFVAFSFRSEAYSHIVLVPCITTALLYRARRDITRMVQTSLRAALVTASAAFAVVCSWVISSSEIRFSAAVLSMILWFLAGFIAAIGWPAFRAAFFPWAFLLLAIPLPPALLERFVVYLQLQSAELTGWLLWSTGTPFLREGLVFQLPGAAIEIARECSGIRSTMALFITGILAAYLFLRSPWTRLLLVLLILPLAIFKNGVRIVTLSYLAVYVDRGFLDGWLHHSGGFVFFGITVGLFVMALAALQRAERHSVNSNQKEGVSVVAAS